MTQPAGIVTEDGDAADKGGLDEILSDVMIKVTSQGKLTE